jgi:Tol biopolymer transport system component
MPLFAAPRTEGLQSRFLSPADLVSDAPQPDQTAPSGHPAEDRLGSWKEIAAYLKRDVTTVQRWERREGMPVHRHLHDKAGSVYAFRAELDAWVASRKVAPVFQGSPAPSPDVPAANRRGTRWGAWTIAAVLAGAGGLLAWQMAGRNGSADNPLHDARFVQLTNFDGNEHGAALSPDGRFVAFLSNRDGPTDVWVTQVGGGQFANLTRNAGFELVNPSVRTTGFSPDGTLVTFWTRKPGGSSGSGISVLAAPVLGGATRPYLEGVAEFDWSGSSNRLVYHTPGPGDPTLVRDPGQEARQIFSAPAGVHAHFPAWSPDERFIYFVQGVVPDRMDIWRVPVSGGTPERITRHESRVSYPVFLNARTLLYLAADGNGAGPWLHTVDVVRREPRRISAGLERYTSLSASADKRRLVASVATARTTLWRVPIGDTPVEPSAPERLPIGGSGSSPRLGPGYLLYVSSKGESDSIWKLQDRATTELWTASATRIVSAPAISRDGRTIAFCARQNGRTSLHAVNADGTNARVVTRSLDVQGTPAWPPDGRSITVAAIVAGAPRLFNVPLDGSEPAEFVKEHSTDPAWSTDGDLAVYSGADIGTTFAVRAVTRAGTATDLGRRADGRPLPELTLSRGSRHVAFVPGRRSLVLLKGEIGHKNLWIVDLDTGAERQLTNFGPDFGLRDFEVAPNGRELVIERVQEESDIVLIELPRR